MVWGFASPCGALRFRAGVRCRVRVGVSVLLLVLGWVLLYCFCFFFFCLFPCAWVGPVDLLLCDLIVHRCRPVGGALPYFNVNAGRFDYKKKKKILG